LRIVFIDDSQQSDPPRKGLGHLLAVGAVSFPAEQVAGYADDLDEIRDDGTGIPGEHLAHVFDRFYRADPARSRATGGIGIGLTIARALTRAHGGDIHATATDPATEHDSRSSCPRQADPPCDDGP
jgi:hypothetical protein